jgi:hypothetical protein
MRTNLIRLKAKGYAQTGLIYNDVTAIKVILFILVVYFLLIFVLLFGVGSELFYFWLDGIFQFCLAPKNLLYST